MDPIAQQHLEESLQLYKSNQIAAAIKVLDGIISNKSASHFQLAKAYYLKALCEDQKKNHDKVFEYTKKANETNPDDHEVHNFLGLQYTYKGETKNAEHHFRKAIEIDKTFALAWLGLSSCKKFTDTSDPDIKKMQQLLKASEMVRDINKQSILHFALGKIYDELKAYEQAIQHYFKANFLRRRIFNSGNFELFSQRLIKQFDKKYLKKFQRTPTHSEFSPIFIVGMLRTGSSLTEQILSCHSKIHAAGEIDDINIMINQLPKQLKVNDLWSGFDAIDNDTLDMLAARYKDRFASLSTTPFIVNKTLSNFIHLGFIKMLFPNAKVIHMQRHPGDTCLSCFFQPFTFGQAHTFDVVHLGYFYRKYRAIMQHWHKTLGKDFILDIRYESLIAEPEKTIRQILKFCGLEWEPACLQHSKQKRSVATSSRLQANQPIYKSSINRWAHYRPWLQDLFNLNELIDEYKNN